MGMDDRIGWSNKMSRQLRDSLIIIIIIIIIIMMMIVSIVVIRIRVRDGVTHLT